MNDSSKKNLKLYGFLFGIVFVMTSILVVSIVFSRNSWKKGLAVELQNTLNELEGETYVVDKFVENNSLMSTSSAVYTLLRIGASQKEKCYGVIVRIPSIVGPVPAVFVCNENDVDKIRFIGYAGDFGIASDTIDFKVSSGIMNYWQKMIPKIVENAKLQDVK